MTKFYLTGGLGNRLITFFSMYGLADLYWTPYIESPTFFGLPDLPEADPQGTPLRVWRGEEGSFCGPCVRPFGDLESRYEILIKQHREGMFQPFYAVSEFPCVAYHFRRTDWPYARAESICWRLITRTSLIFTDDKEIHETATSRGMTSFLGDAKCPIKTKYDHETMSKCSLIVSDTQSSYSLTAAIAGRKRIMKYES